MGYYYPCFIAEEIWICISFLTGTLIHLESLNKSLSFLELYMRRLDQIMTKFSLWVKIEDIWGLPRLCTGISLPSAHASQVHLAYYPRIKEMLRDGDKEIFFPYLIESIFIGGDSSNLSANIWLGWSHFWSSTDRMTERIQISRSEEGYLTRCDSMSLNNEWLGMKKIHLHFS